MLFVVPSVACLLFVDGCLLFVTCSSPFVFRYLLCAVSGLLFVECCLMSVMCC